MNTCDRCFRPLDEGTHGLFLCPYEPRPSSIGGIVDDSIPGGLTIENLGPKPVTFYSHSEKRQYMKTHGIREQVRHVGSQGSDKSPHTSRWV